jgi:RNA polymerase sigma-70 factor (ECF subfamily)
MPLRSDDPLPPSEAFATIMGSVDQLTGGGPSPD